MWLDTAVTCPLCGNEWHFIHTYKTLPVLGYCEKCITHYNRGIEPRNMIEHRRPVTLYECSPCMTVWEN